jgi:hypothetical protein
MVADRAVVADMSVSHEEIIVANLGNTLGFAAASMDRDEFPKDVVVADYELGSSFAWIEFLWGCSDADMRRDVVITTQLGWTFDDGVCTNADMVP